MKPFCAVTLFICISVAPALAQPNPDTLWSRTFGGTNEDQCRSVRQTSDGGYVLAGLTYSFGVGTPTYSNMWLLKTDANGDSLWSRTFGGTFSDQCLSAQQTSDAGYVLAGTTISFGAGGSDFWLVKTDGNGDSVWSRTFGGTNDDLCWSVQQTSDGGYALAGYTHSFGVGDDDFWLVKTDANGDSLWSRTFGGTSTDRCTSVQQTSDGGYVLGGYTYSFGTGSCDFWLVKTDTSGDSLWSRTFGGTSGDYYGLVEQTSDGGYILAGHTYSFGEGTPTYTNSWLVKTDANGDTLWSRAFGGTRSDYCYSVKQTSDGGYASVGSTYSFGWGTPTYSNFWLVKTHANGNSLWSRTFGGLNQDICWSVQQTSDSGYVLAGGTKSFGAGNTDFYLVKTGPESFYLATVYLNEVGTNAVLRWIAPETCDYSIYITTQMSEIGNPPGPGWSVAATLTAVPAGLVEWTDPAGLVPYKRYAVTMSCP